MRGLCKKQTGGVLFVIYAFDPKPTNKGASCENLSVQGPPLVPATKQHVLEILETKYALRGHGQVRLVVRQFAKRSDTPSLQELTCASS